MKVNDKVPVTIGGQVVAQANIKEVGDGQVTLVVPATLVVMATRTELSAPEPVEVETETIITGVETPETTSSEQESGHEPAVTPPSGAVEPAVEEAPAVEAAEVSEQPESSPESSAPVGAPENTSAAESTSDAVETNSEPQSTGAVEND